MMGQLSPDVVEKIKGATWDGLRDKFIGFCDALLDVSPKAVGVLTTVYVKFVLDSTPNAPVYAVVWLTNSRKWIVGLALPEDVDASEFVAPPKRYAGLTKYFYITPDDPIPTLITEWGRKAHENIVNSA